MSGVVHVAAKDHTHRDGPVLLARLARPTAQNQCLPRTKGCVHPEWVISATRKPRAYPPCTCAGTSLSVTRHKTRDRALFRGCVEFLVLGPCLGLPV